jgi:hypothetical protein
LHLDRIHARDVVDDNPDRPAVAGNRHLPLRRRQRPCQLAEGLRAGLDASRQRFGTTILLFNTHGTVSSRRFVAG